MTRIAYRAGLLTMAVSAVLLLTGCGHTAIPTSATPTTRGASPPAGGTTPSATASSPAPGSTPTSVTGLPAGYLPLYPFATLAEVRGWQASYASGGHQPWHLDADITATSFAAWLGYTDVNQVAHQAVGATEARVAIGVALANGSVSTAAVVHLLRFGSGRDAPWEVVGTDDTTLTLDSPAYGSTASSPVTAGGKITGVDESIRVIVRSLHTSSPAGTYCCRPAGGTNSPWSATVTFRAAPGEVITVAASTGGHVAAVERFAVTGLRAG